MQRSWGQVQGQVRSLGKVQVRKPCFAMFKHIIVRTRKKHSLANKENKSGNNENKSSNNKDRTATKANRGQWRSHSPNEPASRDRPSQRANQFTPPRSPLVVNKREHLSEEVMSTPAELSIGESVKTVASEIRVCPNNACLHLLQRFPGEPHLRDG